MSLPKSSSSSSSSSSSFPVLKGVIEHVPPSTIFHRFQAPLSVYPFIALDPPFLWSRNKLLGFKKNNPCDVIPLSAETIAPRGTIEKDQVRPMGISLFVPCAGEDPFRYAHEKVLGRQFCDDARQEQRAIDLLADDDASKQSRQQDLNARVAALPHHCFVSPDPREPNYSGLFYDHDITWVGTPISPDQQVVACHCVLFPENETPIAEFNERAECHQPLGQWSICPYAFNAHAEEVDIPFYPGGDVEAAVLLLDHLIDAQAQYPLEHRFLAALYQYFLALNSEFFLDSKSIIEIGDGLMANFLLQGSRIRSQVCKPRVPDPFPSIEDLVVLSTRYLGSLSLHFVGSPNSQSLPLDMLRDFFSARKYNVSLSDPIEVHSFLLECICSPPLSREHLLELREFDFGGGIKIDYYNVRDGAGVDILIEPKASDPEHDQVGEELFAEMIRLSDETPTKCKVSSVPDSVKKRSNQCRGSTLKGVQCRNRTTRFSGCCHLHHHQEESLGLHALTLEGSEL
jgi:hypothetical protein